jgi:hypothetical protein
LNDLKGDFMSVNVQSSSAASVLESATRSITLAFNPEAENPAAQFTFVTDSGKLYILIEEETTITVTLVNAEFVTSPGPINWISPSTLPQPSPTNANRELSFTVPAPRGYFRPLALSFNVNAGGVLGIVSPTLFLVLPPDSSNATTIDLAYSIDTGQFSLEAADVVLTNQLILVNAITPFEVTINLEADPSVTFNSTPLVGGGSLPSWLVPDLVASTQLKLSISSNPGQLFGFQFALDVLASGGTRTILSPDPILINATIGDG